MPKLIPHSHSLIWEDKSVITYKVPSAWSTDHGDDSHTANADSLTSSSGLIILILAVFLPISSPTTFGSMVLSRVPLADVRGELYVAEAHPEAILQAD